MKLEIEREKNSIHIKMRHADHSGSARVYFVENDGANAPHYMAYTFVPYKDMRANFLHTTIEDDAIVKAVKALKYALETCTLI